MRLNVIGFVTDRAKWRGCNTELCSCEAVRIKSPEQNLGTSAGAFIHTEVEGTGGGGQII